MKTVGIGITYDGSCRVTVRVEKTKGTVTVRQARLLAAKLLQAADRAERHHDGLRKSARQMGVKRVLAVVDGEGAA